MVVLDLQPARFWFLFIYELENLLIYVYLFTPLTVKNWFAERIVLVTVTEPQYSEHQ